MNSQPEVTCPSADTCDHKQGCPHTVPHPYDRLLCSERLFGTCPQCVSTGIVAIQDEKPEEKTRIKGHKFQLPKPIPLREFISGRDIVRVELTDDLITDMTEVWVDDGSGITSYANQFPEDTVFIICERPA